ncbi:tetratricopeptide repeat protein [Candidatus Poriferisodalis sp.]|uniref:tetratricopeptide repeat protein n=1 Tax=Candidatus Poriferisodalis sp. TaxID=3101277 RepID=UPI003C6F384B
MDRTRVGPSPRLVADGGLRVEDRFGLELSTSSAEARDAYVEAIDRMLAADGHVEDCLAAAIAADPSFALAHAAEARQHQLNVRIPQARAAVETAIALSEAATAREQQHVEIINRLVSGKVPQGLDLIRQHVDDYPRDAFALSPACGVFGAIGFSGRIGREAELLAFLEPLATHYGDDWWFATVHAFALIETGRWDRGRELAERSLRQRPTNPHGAHTLIHALFEAGDDSEAVDFLDGWLPASDRASVLHCHIWWHYALALLAIGRDDAALQAVRHNCLPGATTSPPITVFSDSSSFLWRFELAGNPRERTTWDRVREFYEEHFAQPIVFVDAHVGLVYAALGDTEQLQASISVLQELGATGRLPAETTGATLARAYGAFVDEQWSTVVEVLEPLIPQVVRIGGSRAQRDLMTNTLLAAYVRSGRIDEARAFCERVVDRRPTRPVAGFELC